MLDNLPPWILPRADWVGHSPLPPEALRERLTRMIGERAGVFSGTVDKRPYHGGIEDDGFEAVRRIGYRNSFLPVAKGTIEPEGEGSRVAIRLRVHTFVAIFGAVWIAGPCLVGVCCLLMAVLGRPVAWVGLAILPVAIGFFQAMVRFGFALELPRYRKDFLKVCGIDKF